MEAEQPPYNEFGFPLSKYNGSRERKHKFKPGEKVSLKYIDLSSYKLETDKIGLIKIPDDARKKIKVINGHIERIIPTYNDGIYNKFCYDIRDTNRLLHEHVCEDAYPYAIIKRVSKSHGRRTRGYKKGGAKKSRKNRR